VEDNLKRPTTIIAILLLGLGLTLAPAGPASAQFQTTDLDGKWELFALGYYEVFTTYAFGTLTIETGLITEGSGKYHSENATYGGGLNLAPSGTLNGSITGTRAGGGTFSYEIIAGQLNPRKDTIVGSGRSADWWKCTFYLIKTN
jgi:hypothetical protein